ncbi:RelA/SpoT domain-containing protein [Nocardioides okcheonensis]|uniref:RelA/SpoT domain-containing protein n=1 Tax=Nocardioides okcheonensis TaxID=2894081 RepID=UPI001E593847|nr:RelA/SpoT domain-containing protein [Nocardioides okcheonensis]UFN45187.1 RelA/SpoT domain-containing protein [Nocardioides okcheonensis]
MYRAAEPHLHAALEHYRDAVENLLRGRVPEHYVIGRVKTARSLIRKLRSIPNDPRSWESITDKVGIRVICTTKVDCATATSLIREGPWVVQKFERMKGKGHDRLFYPGIHLDIEDSTMVDHAGLPIGCEVQIRTRAQDAWAVASHKLTYKGAITPPKKMRRLVDRLTIFVEVFDDEIHRLFKKRAKLPLYAEAVFLDHVEDVYEEVSGEPAEGVKDLSLIAILMNSYDDIDKPNAAALVRAHWESHPELAELVRDHGIRSDSYHDPSHWLFTQPEVLVVLERLANKRYMLLNAVQNTDLEDIVRSTAIAAGQPLPSD